MIGYEHFTDQDVPWRRLHGALIPLTMPHVITELTKREIRRLIIDRRAPFARWDEDFDVPTHGEWWHIIKDRPEELGDLPKKTRWQVRRGAQTFEVARVPAEIILNEGYDVYRKAFERYETFETILSRAEFARAINGFPDETEFWGVRHRETGQLVAFSENMVRDGACFYDTIWFDPGSLKLYAGYVLVHEMNKHYLNERALSYVTDGSRNISHQTAVHEFLEHKFGFRRAYARLRVVYFPGVRLAIRLLYPFRRCFAGNGGGVQAKLSALLEQERIRRACQ